MSVVPLACGKGGAGRCHSQGHHHAQAPLMLPQAPPALTCSGGMNVCGCIACCSVSSEAPVWPHSPASSGWIASATISAECTTRGLQDQECAASMRRHCHHRVCKKASVRIAEAQEGHVQTGIDNTYLDRLKYVRPSATKTRPSRAHRIPCHSAGTTTASSPHVQTTTLFVPRGRHDSFAWMMARYDAQLLPAYLLTEDSRPRLGLWHCA
jgi:hypothetical protein